MENKLLPRLVMETGVYYLSDLHSLSQAKRVYAAVCRLSPDEYPLRDWEEAVEYILGRKGKRFATPAHACRFLRQELAQSLSGRA